MNNFDLAKLRNTQPETLAFLANDDYYWVRRGVAENPNTPPETLERLANDDYYWVRRGVALNPNTSAETLECLANDKDWFIRELVAKNPNTPQESLKNLANDNIPTVAYYARNNKNYNNPMKLETFEFFEWLENASIEDLEEFANKES